MHANAPGPTITIVYTYLFVQPHAAFWKSDDGMGALTRGAHDGAYMYMYAFVGGGA